MKNNLFAFCYEPRSVSDTSLCRIRRPKYEQYRYGDLIGDQPTVAQLRTKVAETENNLWYNAGRNLGMGKYAGGQAPQQGPDSENPAIVGHTGRVSARANVQNAVAKDTMKNGAKLVLVLDLFLPLIPNKLRLLERKLRKRRGGRRKRSRSRSFLNLQALKVELKEKVQQELVIFQAQRMQELIG